MLIAVRINVFEPISGHLIKADLKWLHKYLKKILLPLLYNVDKVIHNLMGFVVDEGYYKQGYRAKFPMPTKPSVYDKKIPTNATNVVRDKAGAIHTAKIAYYLLFAAAKRETCDFILVVV